MKNIIFSILIILPFQSFISVGVLAQDSEVKDRDFRIEIEPSSFALRGVSGSVHYNLTEDNAFNIGLYSASIDIPNWARTNMFRNVGQDTTDVRLGFELAVVARYKFKLFEDWESNPYVGTIFGWEYFDITPNGASTVRLTTLVLTPYVGYEFYFFKQMLYINPQLRAVFYLGSSSNDSARPETMSNFFMLPQISLGIRI